MELRVLPREVRIGDLVMRQHPKDGSQVAWVPVVTTTKVRSLGTRFTPGHTEYIITYEPVFGHSKGIWKSRSRVLIRREGVMRVYKGERDEDGCEVTVNGKNLDPRFDLRNHSPTGFEWGYGGSGPAQLALAIVADHFRHTGLPKREADESAMRVYQTFKAHVVAGLDRATWTITSAEVDKVIQTIGGTAHA